MQTYCLNCKKDAYNVCSKQVTMTVTNKNESRCAIFWSNKLRILNQKPNKKLIKILNCSYTKHYKTC